MNKGELREAYIEYIKHKGILISTDELAIYRAYRSEFLEFLQEKIHRNYSTEEEDRIFFTIFKFRKAKEFEQLGIPKEKRNFPEKVSAATLTDIYEEFRKRRISSDKIVIYQKYRSEFIKSLRQKVDLDLSEEDEDNCLWQLCRMRKDRKLKKFKDK